MTFQLLGKSWRATFLSSARQGIFFIPVILLLPEALGLAGVQYAQPVADAVTALTCIPLFIRFFKELAAEEKKFVEKNGNSRRNRVG